MKPTVVLALLTLSLGLTTVAAKAADQKSATAKYDLVEASAIPSSAPAYLHEIGCSDNESNYYVELYVEPNDNRDSYGPPILRAELSGGVTQLGPQHPLNRPHHLNTPLFFEIFKQILSFQLVRV